MSLNDIISKLNGSTVKQEPVAKQIKVKTQNEFDDSFSMNLVTDRLNNSGLEIEVFNGEDFPYLINDCGNRYLVSVSARELLADTSNKSINSYNARMKKILSNTNFDGIIHLLPFLMNGTSTRTKIKNGINNSGFVDLTYDKSSLSRRFNQYK